MRGKIKKTVKYTDGPKMARGARLPKDFLPVAKIRLKQPDVMVSVPIAREHYRLLERQAKSLKVPPENILGSVFDVYVRGLQES